MVENKQINKDVLCILKYKDNSTVIVLDYFPIEMHFKNELESLITICDNEKSDVQRISESLTNQIGLEKLNGYYSYCVSLSSAYQGFSINIAETIKEIKNRKELIISKAKDNPNTYDADKHFGYFKSELKNKFILWGKAYSINQAYRKCFDDKKILTFSHRINGWSNPVYKLSDNFSIELKTNFGYGNASYFYTILKYKEIEITPFSEWINYEFAKFSEIIKYSQKYLLQNIYWQDAMEYAKDACNLSLKDENQFILKYVIEECEKMVSGLEELFNKEHFTFKSRDRRKYSVDKKGHVLVEFRGEKISGALDFISKILEFDKIAATKTFIQRIEDCNRRIQPILVDEAKVIKVKIVTKTKERDELQPKYDLVVERNRNYNEKKVKLKKQMIASGQLNPKPIDINKLDNQFEILNPEYKEFTEEYKKITESYRILNEQIKNFTQIRDNIISYDKKINEYFKK